MIYTQVQQHIHSVIPQRIVEEMNNHLLRRFNSGNLKLWGQDKGRLFVRKNLYAALFRDIYGWGYNDLSKEFRNWLGIAGPTLSHNTKLIRKEIGEYFSQFISIGTRSEWDRRASRLSKSKELADVNLFIDSSDFPLEGTNSQGSSLPFVVYTKMFLYIPKLDS